ncbi:MAG: sigma-70 family RNA polymerase sigma factor [Janthinobacterium lividum]
MQTDPSCSAADALYGAHHTWLLGWLTHKLRNTADAADLAHDTFVRVLGREASGSAPAEPLREPRAWLTAIANGLVIDHWRRRELEQAYLRALALLPEAVAPSPEARLLVLETLYALDALLDGLKPAVRSALLRARLDGLTVPQVAAELGVSVATAERYLAQALRHCYDYIYATR